MLKINDLKDKRIAIWGLGVEGKAVLKVLSEKFPDKKIEIIDDQNSREILKNVDVVIRSPGVSIYKPEIVEAEEKGVQFITEKSLFFGELDGVKTIGITGTKGKTTTSTFFAYVLRRMGYDTMLAGNMGVPTIELLEEARKKDFVVVELSSYQTSDLISFPMAGILLNIFPEHLDWHGSHEAYYRDKVNLLRGTKYKIVNGEDKRVLEYTEEIGDRILFGTDDTVHYSDGYFWDGDKKLFSTKNMKLLGEHNYRNLCSVLATLRALGIDFGKLRQEYFDEFEPVEHRLETIRRGNILYVNDSISTTPETAIACYETFRDRSIYGILGGFDRQQNFGGLVRYIKSHKNIKFIALLGRTGGRLAEEFSKNGFGNFLVCATLDECVKILYEKAKNDMSPAIILSPAAPSYDMYKNFEERGREFKGIVANFE